MISNCCGKTAKLEFREAKDNRPEGYYWICPECKQICLPEEGNRKKDKEDKGYWE